MSNTKRDYRTNLSVNALVFLDKKEVACTISDISITGAQLEIHPQPHFKNAMMLAEFIEIGDEVDFSVEEMHFDGKIKVVRKEIKNDKLYLSIELDDLFFGLENLAYKRKVYRTSHRMSGLIIMNGKSYEAVSQNISANGLTATIFEEVDIINGAELTINFYDPDVNGKARVVWHKTESEKTLIGLEFIQLMEPVKGIATFKI